MKHTARFSIRTPLAIATSLLASAAVGQTPPDYGHDFVTVGSPGNRGTLPSERPNAFDPEVPIGGVAHEYRITRTEVLASQWIDFVRAYAPFYTGNPRVTSFDGGWTFQESDGSFRVLIGAERFPSTPSWHMAARYCNWLHNDRVNEAWAFESGAYDTSTFTQNADGTRNDQPEHSPGARYWIPTYHELIKAFYHDPDRYGPGQEGYWLYPQGSNAIPIPGVTTNAGLFPNGNPTAGQFPNAASPWGLLDGSGGATEFTETTDGVFRRRLTLGSSWQTSEVFMRTLDRLDWDNGTGEPQSSNGFRVASAVPAPQSIALLVIGCFRARIRGPR
jgi:hypothetical protein